MSTDVTVARPGSHGQRHRHSPRVRRLAMENGVALETIAGTGPRGRVSPGDVLRAAADRSGPIAAPHGAEAGHAVSLPKVTSQLTTVVEVDLTRVVALRDRIKDAFERRTGVPLSMTAFFAQAALEALRLHPMLNASVGADGQTVTRHASQHLGVAVEALHGLVVPVLRDAGDLSLLGLARKIADLTERARMGVLEPGELAGATFTLANAESRGALFETPIVSPHQAGSLATGAVVERPVAFRHEDGNYAIAIRSMAYCALSYDQRLVDAITAARYLGAVKTRLEGGEFAPPGYPA